MPEPTIISTFPAHEDTGIPVGVSLKVYFDQCIDEQSAKDNIVLYGRDFDRLSGPDLSTWTSPRSGENPFHLASPGFKGLHPLKVESKYYELGTETTVEPDHVYDSSEETSLNIGTLIVLKSDTKSNASFSPNTEYTLMINGDPSESGSTGINSRTFFDPEPDSGNTSEGSIKINGSWSGVSTDVVNVKITTAGDIGTAKYKFWYGSEAEIEARTGLSTSRRYRPLEDGLEIQWLGSGFVLNDTWIINVQEALRMETNYKVVFTTNDGSYSEAPATTSTPATCTPSTAATTLDPEYLSVLEMIPAHGSWNIKNSNRKIQIIFDDDLDPDTVTLESVKLWKYPSSGHYADTYEPIELQKTLEVEDNILTIRF